MPSKQGSDRSFEAIRFKAVLGLFIFSLIFLMTSVWFIHQHIQEREYLGQVIGDNRQLVENQRLLQGAMEQVKSNLARQNSRLKTKSQALTSSEQARSTLEQERQNHLIKIQQRTQKVDAVRNQLTPAFEGTPVKVFLNEDLVTIRLPGKDLFASAEASLQPKGSEILGTVAEILRTQFQSLPIRIEGHTDNIPIGDSLKGRYPSNFHLSALRASSAVSFLIEQGELKPKLLEAVGKGDTIPIADNATEEGRSQNRRIDIVIQLDALK